MSVLPASSRLIRFLISGDVLCVAGDMNRLSEIDLSLNRELGSRGKLRLSNFVYSNGRLHGDQIFATTGHVMASGQSNEIHIDILGDVCGPDVKLVRSMKNGDKVIEFLPAAVATVILLFDDIENGNIFVSGHIEYLDVLDVWGGSI